MVWVRTRQFGGRVPEKPVSCPEKAASHRARAQGWQLPPARQAPTWRSFAVGFGTERGKGQKK